MPSGGGVFISRWHHGSPAHRYSLFGMQFITELDGQPVPDMASFMRIAAALPDNTFVRVRLEEHESERQKVRGLLCAPASCCGPARGGAVSWVDQLESTNGPR